MTNPEYPSPPSEPDVVPTQPAGGAPTAAAPSPSNGFAITALVVGSVAFLTGLWPFWGLLVGGLAVLFGVLALTRKQSGGFAVTGLILGSIAALTSLVTTSLLIFGTANLNTDDAQPAPPVSVPAQPSAEPDDETEPTTEPAPETVAPITVSLEGDGNTAPFELDGDYKVTWSTAGDCYYSADLEGADRESLFSASDVASGETYIYGFSGNFYVQMITGPAPNCGWSITFERL